MVSSFGAQLQPVLSQACVNRQHRHASGDQSEGQDRENDDRLHGRLLLDFGRFCLAHWLLVFRQPRRAHSAESEQNCSPRTGG
jgi:hypothetical protein